MFTFWVVLWLVKAEKIPTLYRFLWIFYIGPQVPLIMSAAVRPHQPPKTSPTNQRGVLNDV